MNIIVCNFNIELMYLSQWGLRVPFTRDSSSNNYNTDDTQHVFNACSSKREAGCIISKGYTLFDSHCSTVSNYTVILVVFIFMETSREEVKILRWILVERVCVCVSRRKENMVRNICIAVPFCPLLLTQHCKIFCCNFLYFCEIT